MEPDVIDLAEFPAAERFARWHAIVSAAASPQVVGSEHEHNFNARAELLALGPVALTSFQYPSLDSKRGLRQIRQGDPETYQLALPVTGASLIAQDRHETVLRPAADFALIDSSQPHAAQHAPDRPGQRAHSVTIVIPRVLVPVPRDRVVRLAGQRLDSSTGFGALLATQMLHIVRHADEFRPSDANFLGQHLIDLTAATIGQYLDVSEHLSDDARRRVLRSSIDRFIDAHLSDPALGVPAIAAAHNISVRQVHRLFEGGRTVTEEIKVLRLERCRRDLLNAGLAGMAIHQIARRHGIVNSALSKFFRRAYGMTPTEYRDRHAILGRAGRAPAARRAR
ncbi:helix-turn-helix domain-containing protein [Dactylosporangium sucinum]|uniref:HTH araC/xylS-type domain-containing protein n=1 Tax=Dactylosporangium sucinum TaxID=1424081 RepID=A0A917WQU7_9ACTN|nr:helix-turn-helix domain-containing protein [Dactylosporangium sucinum]GGM23906.1 hypothetical protein GCM10007977_026330 [Dactylosporangium sucinum]